MNNLLVVNSLVFLEGKPERSTRSSESMVQLEVRFISPKNCREIAFENQWQSNFTVNIDDILKDSDLSVVAEVNGHLAHWMQITFKPAYVAEIEKRMLATPESAYVYGVYTAKVFRKMGIASTVLEKALAYLNKRGVKTVHLFVDSHNSSMLRIAEKTGFKAVGEVKLIKIGNVKFYKFKGDIKNLLR